MMSFARPTPPNMENAVFGSKSPLLGNFFAAETLHLVSKWILCLWFPGNELIRPVVGPKVLIRTNFQDFLANSAAFGIPKLGTPEDQMQIYPMPGINPDSHGQEERCKGKTLF